MKNIIKKLLNKKNPNRYLENHNRLYKLLAEYGTNTDNHIWISSNKKVMHVTKTEYNILRNATDMGLKKNAEKVIKLIGSNAATEIGNRYEPMTAVAITLAIIEGLGYIGKIGSKTGHYRAEKWHTRGLIKAFPKKYQSMTRHADKDAGIMHEQFEQQLQGITGTIGSGYDQLAKDLGLLTKKAGTLKTSTADQIKSETQDQMQEQFNIAASQAGAGYSNELAKYSMSLANTRQSLDNQLQTLQQRYRKAARHDRWYENL